MTSAVLPSSSKAMMMTSMPIISPSPGIVGNGHSTTRTLPVKIIIGIVVGVILIIAIIAATIIILLLFVARAVRSRNRVGSDGTSEQRNHEFNAYDPMQSQAEEARHDGGRTVTIQHIGSGNEENNIIVTEVPGEESVHSMELPPPSDAISTIDDIELPNDVQINSNEVPC
jgi:hypothetical protein